MIELDSPTLERLVATLGWTLLHFLWQGAVLGVLFGISLAAATNASARTRYRLALFFMLLLAAAPVASFVWLSPSDAGFAAGAVDAIPTTTAVITVAISSSVADWQSLIHPWLPWTVLIWAAGVSFMTARLLLEWRNVYQLTRVDVSPLSPAWEQRVRRMVATLGMRTAVRAMQSARVHVPMVVGWLRPVILVPVSALTGLTTWQLELVLMHELAHVRRYDHLVNLLQVVVETLLFYHPVVRWVSRVLRQEREHCCDDLVVAHSGDALGYARALTELAGVQSLSLQTSVASDGGQLLSRIRRLVGARKPPRVAAHWTIGVMLAMVAVSVSGLLQPLGGNLRERPAALASRPQVESAAPFESTPPLIQAMPLAPNLPTKSLEQEGDVNSATPAVVASRSISERFAAAQSTSTTPVSAAAISSSAAVVKPDSVPASRIDSPAAADSAHDSAQSRLAADTAVPTEAVVVTAPMASVAGGSPAAGSVVDRARMAAVDRAAMENGVELVWLNPPVVGDQSGAAAQASPERGDLSGDSDGFQPARAIAILQPQPEFPDKARADSIEGWVTVSYVIGRDGRVSNVDIVAAQPRNVFESAVRRAVRSWRFEPMTVDGTTVEQKKTQTIRFSLSDVQPADADDCTVSTGTRICRPAGR
ncbi:MAG TPA: TonB family protein [Steroidobacteraceae bacterium]